MGERLDLPVIYDSLFRLPENKLRKISSAFCLESWTSRYLNCFSEFVVIVLQAEKNIYI